MGVDDVINAATKLSQGGIVLILVFLLLLALWLIKYLLDKIFTQNALILSVAQASTVASKEQTLATNAGVKASEANRESIDRLRDLVNTLITQRR